MTWLMFAAWLLPSAAGADQSPAKGKLLVATEILGGDVFTQTVILLLQYDETGATGLVVNRPTEIEVVELPADYDDLSAYNGTIYWGGPVQMNSLHALQKTDTPHSGANQIVDAVHLVPFNDVLKNAIDDASRLRFFIGYAG